MTIDTFSFRYADTAGFMEWFRYNPAQGLWIDRCDGAMQAKRCRMTEEELAELEEIIRAHKIDEWNDFCKLDLCMCSGNSWTIHVTYRESRDEYIHAMGHSEAPDGFAEGKRAIEAFFEPDLSDIFKKKGLWGKNAPWLLYFTAVCGMFKTGRIGNIR